VVTSKKPWLRREPGYGLAIERTVFIVMTDEERVTIITRRTVIASAALVPVAAIKSTAQAASQAAPQVAQPVFTPDQRRVLEAFIGRLIPADESGPGAVECGAANYFERQLAGELANEKTAILEGLAAVEAYARKTYGAGFADLAPDKQDAALKAIQNNQAEGFTGGGGFFNRMRRLTLEGTFGDPYYGGNKNFAGWDLIRYPGARLAVAPEEQEMTPIKPAHVSAWGGNYGH
jgi:gluconate 2-dehydrogenase gamma chain